MATTSGDIFLKLGDNIKGESIDAEHKDLIDVLSWAWGASQPGSTHSGPGGGSGKATFNDLTLTKPIDLSTNEILKALASGDHIPTATLYVRKAGGTDPLTYFQIDMERILVSKYDTMHNIDPVTGRVTEQVSLNFARFHITYRLQGETGGKASKTQAGWDIPSNKPW